MNAISVERPYFDDLISKSIKKVQSWVGDGGDKKSCNCLSYYILPVMVAPACFSSPTLILSSSDKLFLSSSNYSIIIKRLVE